MSFKLDFGTESIEDQIYFDSIEEFNKSKRKTSFIVSQPEEISTYSGLNQNNPKDLDDVEVSEGE